MFPRKRSLGTNDDEKYVYNGSSIKVCDAYDAIRNFVVKCSLAFMHVIRLIALILFLLPNDHNITRRDIIKSLKPDETFIYETLCILCNKVVVQ
ncbi:unnamed protein product [Didymodactylos carnosus]|uniref:Uncharacterized protein n=1 Tax=Didymodactylos carnosus TaxID=1234261 RepID=A0A815DL04_9BILA|nr:unnamed protein product [Didymodactylos carnosus]CAF1611014.1 unnamed protein product [Didymodactylos carnosus]CAF4128948.1 unnamed protein product [Didymodactylos carnosus]CAF4424589.1 unnamed protein product [Didymodactylos carnosus]